MVSSYTCPTDGYYSVIGYNIGTIGIAVNGVQYTGEHTVFHREKLQAGAILQLTQCDGSGGGGGGWAVYYKAL